MGFKKKRYGKSSISLSEISKKTGKKKAMESDTMIFYFIAGLVIAGIVNFILLKIAYTGAKSTKFNMEFFVNDVGLMTDTIYAVPGDVDYDYRKRPSKFMFDFRPDSLYVYTPVETAKSNMEGNLSSKWSTYSYLFRTEKPFVKKFMFPPMLSFKKRGSMLEISQTGTFDDKEFCPDIDTSRDITKEVITIDPGYYVSNLGTETMQDRFEVNTMIADSIMVLCRSHFLNCKVLRQAPMDEKLAEINLEPKPNLIVSIHTGSYSNPDDKPFKATYTIGSPKSEKLACLISNQFRRDYVVLEPDQITPYTKLDGDYQKILREDVPSIIAEVGNIKNSVMFSQASSINEIASAIVKGIEAYYGKESSSVAVAQAGRAAEPEGGGEEPGAEEPEAEPSQIAQLSTDKGNVKVIVR